MGPSKQEAKHVLALITSLYSTGSVFEAFQFTFVSAVPLDPFGVWCGRGMVHTGSTTG